MPKISTLLRKENLILFLPLILSFIFASILIFKNPIAPDSYLHMGLGRFIIEEQKIPQHADISFKETDPSLEFMTHSWLSDVIFYIVAGNAIPGQKEIYLILLLIPCLLILNGILMMLKIPPTVRVIALSISLLIAPVFWKIHPFVFMPSLILSIIFIYIKWKTGNYKYIWFLPLLLFLWANLIGGYIFIPIIFLLIILAYEIINYYIFHAKTKLSILTLSIIAGVLISLVNPFGIKIWFYFQTFLAIFGPSKSGSTLVGALSITSQSYTKNAPSSILLVLFLLYLLFIILGIAFSLIRYRRDFLKSIHPFIVLLPFCAAGIIWIRFIPFSVFATIPLIVVLLLFYGEKIHSKKILNYFKTATLLGISILSVYFIFNPPRQITIEYPKSQVDFIKKNNLPPNLLTTWETTGYAYYSFYPNKAVIDAQDDFLDENELIETYNLPSSIPIEAFDNIVSENEINTILTSKDTGSLALNISKHADWSLLYIDYSGFVFVKRDAVNDDFISKKSLVNLDLGRNLGFEPTNFSTAAAELERFTISNPESSLALGQLATIYRINHDFKKAENTLNKIPEEKWNFIVKTEMGRIKAAQGECKASEKLYLDALTDRDERNYSRAVLDIAVLYGVCMGDLDRAKHFLKRYNSFVMPPEEHAKAQVIAEELGININE